MAGKPEQDWADEPSLPRKARPRLEVSVLHLDEVKLVVFGIPAEVDAAGASELTPAERDVVRLVLDGCSNREIAERRGCSAKTVANQLRAVYQKLGIASRFELAARLGR